MPPGVCGKNEITSTLGELTPWLAHGQEDSKRTSLYSYIEPTRNTDNLFLLLPNPLLYPSPVFTLVSHSYLRFTMAMDVRL